MWPGGNSWSDESDELFQQTPFPHTPEEIRHKTTKPLKKHQISMSYCWNRHFFQIFSQMACWKCRPKQNTRFKETNCQLLPSDLLIPQMEVIYITPEKVTSNHPEKVTNGRTWWLIFVGKKSRQPTRLANLGRSKPPKVFQTESESQTPLQLARVDVSWWKPWHFGGSLRVTGDSGWGVFGSWGRKWLEKTHGKFTL